MELICYYGWWVLTNGIMQYASFQFLTVAGTASNCPGIRCHPSAGYAAFWLTANGFLTLVNTAFHVTGAVLLYAILLILFSRFALSLRGSIGLAPSAVIITLYTFTEGFSALIMYWVSSNLHSAAAGQAIQMFLSLTMDILYVGALRLMQKRYSSVSGAGAEALSCLFAACFVLVLSIEGGMKLYDFGFEQFLRTIGLSASFKLLFIMVGGLILFFAILRSFHNNLCLAAQQAEAFFLRKRQKGLEDYLGKLKKQNEEYASFQHDIDNHLLVVSELIRGQKCEEAAGYADKLYARGRFSTEFPFAGSTAVDILLQEKLGYAREYGIKTTCRVRIPQVLYPYELELCTILANLLDNGIAACMKGGIKQKESPFLSIKTKEKAGFLLIEAVNSSETCRIFKEGTGLKNIRAAAEAFGGTVDIENKDGVFRIRVLLCLPKIREEG